MVGGRIIVFPIKGRKWCFSRPSIETLTASSESSTPTTFTQLYRKLNNTTNQNNNYVYKAGLLADFVSLKMNGVWDGLGKAPPKTIKYNIHRLGLRLLSGVHPSEILFKTISNDLTSLNLTFPSSLNARLVRRRLRHIAQRGIIIHKKYLYGSVCLLPLTTPFMVLPLPNIPFFWILFRSYSHWTALKGSERLLLLASDSSGTHDSSDATPIQTKISDGVHNPTWMLQPSEELDQLIQKIDAQTGLSDSIVSKICNMYDLNTMDVIKYRDMA